MVCGCQLTMSGLVYENRGRKDHSYMSSKELRGVMWMLIEDRNVDWDLWSTLGLLGLATFLWLKIRRPEFARHPMSKRAPRTAKRWHNRGSEEMALREERAKLQYWPRANGAVNRHPETPSETRYWTRATDRLIRLAGWKNRVKSKASSQKLWQSSVTTEY
jgi:hypothetical protein